MQICRNLSGEVQNSTQSTIEAHRDTDCGKPIPRNFRGRSGKKHRNHKSIVVQQEVYSDVRSFSRAIIHLLRQDPDVVGIGEMRDLDTVISLTNAEPDGGKRTSNRKKTMLKNSSRINTTFYLSAGEGKRLKGVSPDGTQPYFLA